MCRFLAYLGPPAALEALLVAPEHSLLRQSWAPRRQRYGTVNADGFGVAWYDLERRLEPACYRQPRPMWGDRSFGSMAGLVTSSAVLAAVRSATPPAPVEESGTPPFVAGPWAFAHNGAIAGFHDGVGMDLRRLVSDRRGGGILGASDSEVLFALALDRLDAGASMAHALADVVRTVTAQADGRLNLVMTDGRAVVATTYGDTLFVLEGAGVAGGGSIVASEPCDDDRSWRGVPDHSLVEAGIDQVTTADLFSATSPP